MLCVTFVLVIDANERPLHGPRVVMPLSRSPLRMSNTSSNISGDRAIDGSSISRSFGSSNGLRATRIAQLFLGGGLEPVAAAS